MKDVKRKKDRRVSRTKRGIRNALIELIIEKHYDEITVQEIIDRADIGRSTFYLHFRDKEDVLISDWKQFLNFFTDYFNWANLFEGRFLPIKELFQHLADFQQFYRALEKSNKSERLFKTGKRFLTETIEKELAEKAEARNIPIPVIANYLANEIFELMRWWLDNYMPNTPEEMDQFFHELVMPGIRNAIGKMK